MFARYLCGRRTYSGLCTDQRDPVGIYLGTTNGELWGSNDGDATWQCIARHLPHIFSVTSGERA